MFPIFVICLAILFLLATYSGLLDEFAAKMQELWGTPPERGPTLLPPSPGDKQSEDDSEGSYQFYDRADGRGEGADQEDHA